MIRYKGVQPIVKRTLLGHPFTVYKDQPLVPRIQDQYLDCSVYLYPSADAAVRGERIGGCGFLAAYPVVDPDWQAERRMPRNDFHLYVISNRHVAKNHPVVRLNTHDGRCDVVPFSPDDWTYSDTDDLAIVPIKHDPAYKYLSVGTEAFLTPEVAQERDVGIGDEVFMVGRFVSHDGTQQNSPSVRYGHVSMMPGEPVHHPSNLGHTQDGFLVEIHSISGYSGSPVFVRPVPAQLLPTYAMNLNTNVTGSSFTSHRPVRHGGPWLLGVEWGYINSHDQWANNSGISGVVPAWRVLELLETEKFRLQRQVEQEELAELARRGGSTLTDG